MSTLTADPTPEQVAEELLPSIREFERILEHQPEEAATLTLPWERTRLMEVIDVAVKQKYWRTSYHLLGLMTNRRKAQPINN